MTHPILKKHGNHLESNTYERGSQRIDFFTSHIEQYIKRYGIMPFDIFNFSHHSSVYVDINILTFLKDYFINPQTLY